MPARRLAVTPFERTPGPYRPLALVILALAVASGAALGTALEAAIEVLR